MFMNLLLKFYDLTRYIIVVLGYLLILSFVFALIDGLLNGELKVVIGSLVIIYVLNRLARACLRNINKSKSDRKYLYEDNIDGNADGSSNITYDQKTTILFLSIVIFSTYVFPPFLIFDFECRAHVLSRDDFEEYERIELVYRMEIRRLRREIRNKVGQNGEPQYRNSEITKYIEFSNETDRFQLKQKRFCLKFDGDRYGRMKEVQSRSIFHTIYFWIEWIHLEEY